MFKPQSGIDVGEGNGIYLHHAGIELFQNRAEAVPCRYSIQLLGEQRISWNYSQLLLALEGEFPQFVPTQI